MIHLLLVKSYHYQINFRCWSKQRSAYRRTFCKDTIILFTPPFKGPNRSSVRLLQKRDPSDEDSSPHRLELRLPRSHLKPRQHLESQTEGVSQWYHTTDPLPRGWGWNSGRGSDSSAGSQRNPHTSSFSPWEISLQVREWQIDWSEDSKESKVAWKTSIIAQDSPHTYLSTLPGENFEHQDQTSKPSQSMSPIYPSW